MGFALEYRDDLYGGSERVEEMGILNRAVALVEPADSVLEDMWDVFSTDREQTYLGTFSTDELEGCVTRLVNRSSGHPWSPGQQQKYGTWHPRKKRKRGKR